MRGSSQRMTQEIEALRYFAGASFAFGGAVGLLLAFGAALPLSAFALARASAIASLNNSGFMTPGMRNVPTMKDGVELKPSPSACSLLRASSASISALWV